MAAFNTPWFNSQERNFFNVLNKTKTPHLVLAAETEDFDEEVAQQWRDEGFDVKYVPLLTGGMDFIRRVHTVGANFGVSEQYAIVAFGDAAYLALEAHLKPNNPYLVAVIAYYPTAIPSITTKFPASIQVLVHLAGSEVGVRKTSEALGIQGKRKTVRKRIERGLGHGESLRLAYPAYTYADAEPGFAEHDLDEFDSIAEGLAFTRSLTTLRKAFRIETPIELIRDQHTRLTITTAVTAGDVDASVQKAMSQTRTNAHLLHVPTLTGGIGSEDLSDFYTNFFTPLPSNCNFSIRLLSRTIGTDRVVDELFLTCTHAAELPWLLPGVPATNKSIEIAMVSVFHVRGAKMASEHVYWDQASVLVQVGVLDPKLVPGKKKSGVKQLPVVGVEAARAVERGSSRTVNELIPDW